MNIFGSVIWCLLFALNISGKANNNVFTTCLECHEIVYFIRVFYENQIQFANSLLTFSVAAFTWMYFDDSVTFTQGETAKLFWSVDVGNDGEMWIVYIARKKVKSENWRENLIIWNSDSVPHIGIEFQQREADMELVVQGTSSVVNVTFNLKNMLL